MQTNIRTAYLDPDNRRDPKTDHHCHRCHKDFKPNAKTRQIHIINGGWDVLHPEDESKYVSDAGDMYVFEVGLDCARKIGWEFTF